MSFFDDAFGGDNLGSTLSGTIMGAGTGFLMGGPQGAFVGAGIGFAGAVEGNRQKRKGVQANVAANEQAQRESVARKNALVKEVFEKRKRGGLGEIKSSSNLAPGQQGASNQGTSLTTNNSSPSILGN